MSHEQGQSAEELITQPVPEYGQPIKHDGIIPGDLWVTLTNGVRTLRRPEEYFETKEDALVAARLVAPDRQYFISEALILTLPDGRQYESDVAGPGHTFREENIRDRVKPAADKHGIALESRWVFFVRPK